MISLDPVELLKRIVEVTVQDTLQRNLIPSAFIIPIVFRVKLFRYHVIKFYDIETMDDGNFPYLMSISYLSTLGGNKIKQDFMVRLSSYESRFIALLKRLNQALTQYIPGDTKHLFNHIPHLFKIKRAKSSVQRKI